MWRGAAVLWVAFLANMGPTAPAQADAESVHACMTPDEAHDVLTQQKLVAPFRALREAVRGGQGEAVGVELCRLGDAYIYDVTLLHRDGHVRHALVNARTGALAGHPK